MTECAGCLSELIGMREDVQAALVQIESLLMVLVALVGALWLRDWFR